MDLQDRIGLVTGGTGALGSVVVERFVKEGMNVAATYRSEKELQRLPPALRQKVVFLKADVSTESDVLHLFDEVINKFGRLDILVNTVGGFVPGKRVADVSVDDWDKMMMLNLRSTFLCMREALRRMKRHSYGRIVSISAMTGLKPSLGKSAYAISKAGVVLLTEIAAEEQKGTGITINAIAPSIIATKANMESSPGEDFSKWVTPEQIADAICYLCTASAGCITGTTFRAFGGM